jgi:mannonate dehydratase
MKRRELLKSIGGAGVLGLASPLLRSQEQVARTTRGMATPRIKDISVIECEPAARGSPW